MKILFLHPNMPGQYKHLARIFGEDKNNQVVFLTKPKPDVEIPGVKKIEYTVTREPNKETHRYLIGLERGVLASQEVWRLCKKMKDEGFVPDVIVGHLGWGDGLFLKDIFPDTPLLAFLEFYYDAHGADVDFLKDEGVTSFDDKARIRMKNSIHLFNLTYCDWGLSPTFFQRDRHPKEFHDKISVLHDGVDVDVFKPQKDKKLTLPSGVTLTDKDEVITYVSRNFEPYRGFPQFMRAAEKILKDRPNAHIVMVGQDGVSYGKHPEDGVPYRHKMMKEVDLDMSRFHYLGYLPQDDLLKVLQISRAHIYLTVPFVLSWSMMESMAAGCLMICSDTAPVREVIEHDKNGLLVDFFDYEKLAETVCGVFDHPTGYQDLRDAARKTIVDRYALEKLLPLHVSMIKEVAEGQIPPPSAKKIEKLYS